MIAFIKPTPVITDDLSFLDKYEHIRGVKVYQSVYDLETEKEKKESILNMQVWEDFREEVLKNDFRVVGHVEDYQGNRLHGIVLRNILHVEQYVREKYLNTWSFTRDSEVSRYYNIYEGLKKYKQRDNKLGYWFSDKVIADNFNNTPTPQILDQTGHVTLLADHKSEVLVNYGKPGELKHEELKTVYCSKNGRYIKYKGKNYYINEGS